MAKYKNVSYEQHVFVPISFEKQILPGTFEYTINYLIDNEVDVSIFEDRYKNDITGRPAWDPSILLKIILYAYSKGIISSRKIAKYCDENVIFMALSADSHPHFTTIADFISSMEEEIILLFRNILLVCSEMNLIEGTMFGIDGCKLSSNASKEWSGTKADLHKKKEKIEKTIKHILNRHREKDKEEGESKEVIENKDDQIERIKAKARKIERWLKENEDKIGKRGRKLQSNITDNDSAKMKTTHGVLQGYNGIAMVDSKHQIIVHAEAFGSGQEYDLLSPLVKGAQENMEEIGKGKNYFKGKKILGDTGFHNEDNLKEMSDKNIDAYIPDSNFRKRDPRFKTAVRHKLKKKQFKKEDFRYDKEKDIYICPNNKVLTLEAKYANLNNSTGRRYQAKQKDCTRCPIRNKCLRKETTKRRALYIVNELYGRNYSKEMVKKIDSERGREIYSRRMGIIEPVFANIRYAKRLDRFTLRGRSKVNIQWVLYAMVHNIEKISKFGLN